MGWFICTDNAWERTDKTPRLSSTQTEKNSLENNWLFSSFSNILMLISGELVNYWEYMTKQFRHKFHFMSNIRPIVSLNDINVNLYIKKKRTFFVNFGSNTEF